MVYNMALLSKNINGKKAWQTGTQIGLAEKIMVD